MNVFRPIVFARFQGKEPDVERARKTMKEELPRLFDYLEGELQGREFAIGSALSIADVAIASQLAQLALAVGPLDGDRWPALRAHHDRMVARPSFAANLAICRKIVKSPVDLGP
jgi:glutathione S-transferase